MEKLKIKDGEDFDIPDGCVEVVIDKGIAKCYFSTDKEISDNDILSSLRSYAKIKVRQNTKENLSGEFISSADGSDCSYRCGIEDQLNIISAAFSNKKMVVTKNGEKVSLDSSQVSKLNEDMAISRDLILNDKKLKYADIDLAVTEEQILLILESLS